MPLATHPNSLCGIRGVRGTGRELRSLPTITISRLGAGLRTFCTPFFCWALYLLCNPRPETITDEGQP
jgi:hypothetical protein